MAGPAEYELSHDAEIDLYLALREDRKALDAAQASWDLHSAAIRRMVGEAEYVTVHGERVLQVVSYTPVRFDSAAFKRFDHRLYESFCRPADKPVVQLRWVGERP